jgi:acetyltransferase-like isoleucine patch superfamily enzyme
MQYIQLQGQVAADLDLPIEGSYNLFIDTSDNSIKAKDSDGHMHGGGGLSLTELTREEIGQLVASASLTPGAFYKITGAASQSFLDANQFGYSGYGNEIQKGGTTIILQATTDKTLSKKGIGLFYVPNYENPNIPTAPPDYNYLTWDNTHRLFFYDVNGTLPIGASVTLYSDDTENSTTATLEGSLEGSGSGYVTLRLGGESNTFFEDPNNLNQLQIQYGGISGSFDGVNYTSSYSPGDCVIFGGRVWQNLSGSIGYREGGNQWPINALNLNPEDWTPVAFNETHYTISADLIEYEFEKDNISYRNDGRNEVRCEWSWWDDNYGYNTIGYFPWGHYGVERVSFTNTYLHHFVNFPWDSEARDIKFEHDSLFNATTWGHQSYFNRIYGAARADFGSNRFGRGTDIWEIAIGIDAEFRNIRTSADTQIYEITIGSNASFYDVDMYYGSEIYRVEIGTDGFFGYSQHYEWTNVYGVQLGIDSNLSSFTLYTYSEIKDVTIGANSWIQYFDLAYSSCLKRTTIASDAHIGWFDLGVNSFIRQVNLSDRAYIDSFTIGDYSNLQNIDLGAYAYMNDFVGGYSTDFQNIRLDARANIYNVYLGYQSEFSEIQIAPNSTLRNINNNIGDISFTSSYVQSISLGPWCEMSNIQLGSDTTVSSIVIGADAYFGEFTLEESAHMDDINLMGDTMAGGITLQSGSNISNFQFGLNAGFGPLIVSSSVELNRFEVGNGYYFGEMEFTSSMSNITISRGFNNLGAETDYYGYNGGDVNSSNYMNLASNLSYNEKHLSVYAINPDGNDFSENSLDYYLPDGLYNGQTIELVLVGNINNLYDGYASGIRVWMGNLRLTGGTLADKAGTVVTNTFWYPFSKGTYSDLGVLRDTNPKAIWLKGAWTIDNGSWSD